VSVKRIALLIFLFISSLTVVSAQNSSVENLRSQLNDVEKREGELQARAKRIDEDMKPENIERFFALNGSTRPEELREERRRQLESERTNVRSQLDQLAQSRVRLEAAIATAEAAAYRQSALPSSYNPPSVVNPGNKTAKPRQTRRRTRRKRTH
jgi:chromosome segregation ATPase